jgi:hypothetical protein
LLTSILKGLFVWAVAGWLCRESCCVGKVAVQEKLLFQVLVFGNLAGYKEMNCLNYP